MCTVLHWQIGEWLVEHIESDETSCCYLADGAESQQLDYLGQLLARRVNGKLDIKALDLAQLRGKTAAAQAVVPHSPTNQAHPTMSRLHPTLPAASPYAIPFPSDPATHPQAAAFEQSLSEVAHLMQKAGKADDRLVNLIRRFVPTCSMNDRASPARAAARLVLGLCEGDDDPLRARSTRLSTSWRLTARQWTQCCAR